MKIIVIYIENLFDKIFNTELWTISFQFIDIVKNKYIGTEKQT